MFSALVRSKLQKYCLYICLDFIQGDCTESLDGQVQGATTHPPLPHRIDLAGLSHRKNSLTLHCFLT